MVELATVSTTDAAEAYEEADVGVFTIGSTEQHGPHLPLGTDHMIAKALADTVADREDVISLPMIPVGASNHHRHFHGTLTTSGHVLEQYIRDILESAASHGLDKFVVVNGHGGNSGAITRAAEELRQEQTAYVTRWSWSDAVADLKEEQFGIVVGHADGSESSMMLYLHDEYTKRERFENAEDGGPESEHWGQSVHGGTLPFDTLDFTSTGATGYPTDASKEAGEKLFDAASSELHSHIDWLAEQNTEELWPKGHK